MLIESQISKYLFLQDPIFAIFLLTYVFRMYVEN